MMKWETGWALLDIIFVQSPIQMIRDHFATQLIEINDGNIAIADHVIVQKVEVNVCVGIQIIIISNIAWAANRNFKIKKIGF